MKAISLERLAFISSHAKLVTETVRQVLEDADVQSPMLDINNPEHRDYFSQLDILNEVYRHSVASQYHIESLAGVINGYDRLHKADQRGETVPSPNESDTKH